MNELNGNTVMAVAQDFVDIGQATSGWSRWLPTIAAALLGIVIISTVGFASGIAHDAAHDVRHTMTFPCH